MNALREALDSGVLAATVLGLALGATFTGIAVVTPAIVQSPLPVATIEQTVPETASAH